MNQIIIYLLDGLAGLIIGGAIGSLILKKLNAKKIQTMLIEAEEKAEVMKKEKILQAKEKFLQLKAEHEKVINEKNIAIQKNENRLNQREAVIAQRYEELQRKQKDLDVIRENLNNQLEIVARKQTEFDRAVKEQVEKLETIAGLSANEAKEQLIETLKEEAKSDAMVLIKDTIEEAKFTAQREAKKIVIETIQRTAAEHAIENTVSVFPLENDDIKGRIIGKDGRSPSAWRCSSDLFKRFSMITLQAQLMNSSS